MGDTTKTATFYDGLGREIQKQVEKTSNSKVITGKMYDSVGCLVLETKPGEFLGSIAFDTTFIENGYEPGDSMTTSGIYDYYGLNRIAFLEYIVPSENNKGFRKRMIMYNISTIEKSILYENEADISTIRWSDDEKLLSSSNMTGNWDFYICEVNTKVVDRLGGEPGIDEVKAIW